MYETLADINKSLVLMGFFSAAVVAGLMGKRTWPGIVESWPMRAMFISQVSITAIFAVNALTLYLGQDYWGREFVRLVVYGAVPASQMFLAIVIATFTAGNARPLPLPKPRKSGKAGKAKFSKPPTVAPSGPAGDSGASDD